jgi:2-isopropylmalate synthase
MAAIRAGATHFQGTINGYGERTGNADLLTVISNLQLKEGMDLLAPPLLAEATRIAHQISEVTNVPPYSRQPYVGASAFAHKAGLHASAIKVDPNLYQHTDPVAVGNDMRMLVSGMAGRASIELKARELGFDLSGQNDLLSRIVKRVKELEAQGWTFEAADASFDLLLREELGNRPSYFRVESWRVITDHSYTNNDPTSEATVKLWAAGERVVVTAEGNGPVDALDRALRQSLTVAYPELAKIELIDFRVRLFDAAHGTDASTRVLMEHSDGVTSWNTVGVAPNIVEASWIGLTDGVTYGLIRRGVEVR